MSDQEEEKKLNIEDVWDQLSEENKKFINEVRARRKILQATLDAYKEFDLYPETQSALEKEIKAASYLWVPIIVDTTRCVGSICKKCMPVCPRNAVQWDSTPDRPVFLYNLCYPYNMSYCNPAPCISACIQGALGKVYF